MGKNETNKMNASIDIVKVFMALLVVGIHTEPFGFNIWLDRGFGIVTRLCVPFFFIASSYFYWKNEKGAVNFLKRIGLLYLVWSIIYLPFDVKEFSEMHVGDILKRFLWDGNNHALWYLCGTIIGFLITILLLKVCKPKAVLIIAIVCLIIGCLKSTWSPLFEMIFKGEIKDWLGSRNGLFYAFPYIAVGMAIAKREDQGKVKHLRSYIIGLIVSIAALTVESLLFVIYFKTKTTILWISVLPYTYCVFMIANNIEIQLNTATSLLLRKISTLIYVSQYLFIYLFSSYIKGMLLFCVVALLTFAFGLIVIKLSEVKGLRFMKYLY